jgi:thymidylate synthase (FAD)
MSSQQPPEPISGTNPEPISGINVLDHGFVRLVSSMGSDLTVVNSARVSFGKAIKKLEQKDTTLIDYLANHGHTSPFRHVQFQFHVKAPEFVARQWYKHVIGCGYTGGDWGGEKDHAWNEISGRYVDQSEVDIYYPEIWRAQSANNKQASEGEIFDQVLASHLYKDAVGQALVMYKELLLLGVAKEQARVVLPLGIYTEWYWTASLHAVAHFINLRTHAGAQWEIQQYANAIHHEAASVAPVSLDALTTSAELR